MMDWEIQTLGSEDNLIVVTIFGDGAFLLEDREGAQILITKEQISELAKIGEKQ